MIGKSFVDAWDEGASIYRRWEAAADSASPRCRRRVEYVPSLPGTPPPAITTAVAGTSTGCSPPTRIR